MKIHTVIEFLKAIEKTHGDIQLQEVTGFWVRQIPRTGEWVVICSKGNGYIDLDIVIDASQIVDKPFDSVEKYYFQSIPVTDNPKNEKNKNARS